MKGKLTSKQRIQLEDLSHYPGFEDVVDHVKNNEEQFIALVDGKSDEIKDFSFVDYDKLKVDETSHASVINGILNIVLIHIFKPSFL